MSILFGVVYTLVSLVVALVLTFGVVVAHNYIIANKEKVINTVKLFLVAVTVVAIFIVAIWVIPAAARAEEQNVEPESICFPPVMLLAVTPIARKKKIAIKQKMHPDFFMTLEKYEKDAKQHIAIDLEDSRAFVWVYNPDRTKQLFAIPSGVEKAISEAARISPAAFVTTFVQAYGHQAVIYCNYHDHLAAWINTTYSEKINEAKKLLISSVQTVSGEHINKINDIQIVNKTSDKKQKTGKGGKDDPCVMMVECTIDEDPHQKLYTFRTIEALNIGDRRTAKLKSGERKPVTVRDVLPPCFASQLDHPLDWYVTLEVFLLAEHQNVGFGIRKPANGVLTDEEMAEAQRRVDSMIYCDQDVINETEEAEQAE